jgi:hypothetical protein
MLTASSCIERYAELVDRRYERIRWGALVSSGEARPAAPRKREKRRVRIRLAPNRGFTG